MKKAPNIWRLDELLEYFKGGTRALVNGCYVPARPLGFYSLGNRMKAAWMVFTGKADALIWPGQ
jgi:hypothetical protein